MKHRKIYEKALENESIFYEFKFNSIRMLGKKGTGLALFGQLFAVPFVVSNYWAGGSFFLHYLALTFLNLGLGFLVNRMTETSLDYRMSVVRKSKFYPLIKDLLRHYSEVTTAQSLGELTDVDCSTRRLEILHKVTALWRQANYELGLIENESEILSRGSRLIDQVDVVLNDRESALGELRKISEDPEVNQQVITPPE